MCYPYSLDMLGRRNILALLLVLLIPSLSWAAFKSLPDEVSGWARQNGFKAGSLQRGTSGCLKGKRYVPMNASGVKGYAIFFHPIYQEETAVVSNVMFEFSPPVSKSKARSYAIKLAPIVGTRPPTQKQKINPDPKNPCIGAASGNEERYTEDWILEFFQGKGGVTKLNVYNDYIR